MARWNKVRGPSRRAFLGGATAMIGLPTLVSLLPTQARAAEDPTRLLIVYVPNGIHMPEYRPVGEGSDFTLPSIMASMERHRSDLLVLSGLSNYAAKVPVAGDHARGTGSFLTCETVKKTGGSDIQNGISVDQMIAQEKGDLTLLPSLELGVSGGASVGSCDSGYSCAYTRNISWAGPSTPVPKQTNPSQVFDRLFAGLDNSMTKEERERRARWRLSVLDSTLDDVHTLQGRLGSDDKLKLDEYLTGVRALEKRIQDDKAVCEPPDRPGWSYDYAAHVDIMLELAVLAFECDLTRVSTFMMENAGSNRTFGFLDVSGAHHSISHHQNVPENLARLTTIATWEVERVARVGDLLAAKGLLESTTVMFSSEIGDGNRHTHHDLPVFLLGGGGGAVKGGRHVNYGAGRPIADLYLSFMRSMGVQRSTFGSDGTSPLDLTG
ncbi:MAG: hypothetical protein ACI9MC_000300 [Kiritimatiellia bacterium]|jgi:hypothetical protein